MNRTAGLVGVVALGLAASFALAAADAGDGGQEAGLVGYLAKDRVVELAAASDGSLVSFAPSAASLALFAAYVDPIHLRVFLCASRPADLAFAARLAKCVEAAANPVFSAEFVGVAADLSEPAALIGESAVTAAPEAVVYWMGAEIARLRPEGGGDAVDAALADLIQQARTRIAEEMILDNEFFRNVFHSDLLLDCKRCHGPR
ncbi:MAG: hypothetical protein KA243_05550 [Candidatus Aminicenantes bacterium]|nr:hypothetical protein [Candidatus Aminicenantes bacterium]NLH77369.1 hypothetical protein [Acidobacteriota bacterium]